MLEKLSATMPAEKGTEGCVGESALRLPLCLSHIAEPNKKQLHVEIVVGTLEQTTNPAFVHLCLVGRSY